MTTQRGVWRIFGVPLPSQVQDRAVMLAVGATTAPPANIPFNTVLWGSLLLHRAHFCSRQGNAARCSGDLGRKQARTEMSCFSTRRPAGNSLFLSQLYFFNVSKTFQAV